MSSNSIKFNAEFLAASADDGRTKEGTMAKKKVEDADLARRRREAARAKAEKRRVQCQKCGKTFCDKGALKIHNSAVHLREMHKWEIRDNFWGKLIKWK